MCAGLDFNGQPTVDMTAALAILSASGHDPETMADLLTAARLGALAGSRGGGG